MNNSGLFSAILSAFSQWQIICIFAVGLNKGDTHTDDKMLIMITIATIVALLFGKVTIKEINEYVRKHRKESGKGDSGR